MDFCEGPVDLMLGNCLERLDEIDDETVDLTVTSPPYDNLRSYNGGADAWSENVWRGVLAELYRVTKEGGVVVWIVADATIKRSETGTSFKQALFAMECGFNLHDTMIWTKNTNTAIGANTRYASLFDYMFVFSRGKVKTSNLIRDKQNKSAGLKISLKATTRQKDGSMKPNATIGKVIGEYGVRYNVWSMPPNDRSKTFEHPATFPIQLASDHIVSWSKECDTVLDPFMGSGTTGVAAIKSGRSFVGIELDPTYYYDAAGRIFSEIEVTDGS